MSNKPSIDDYINEVNKRMRDPNYVPVNHSTGTELRGKIYSRKQHPIRPEVNYNRPLNRLRVPKREIKTSPKTMRGLRFQNMYGKPKEVKK